jgi:TPR repeat protein
MKANIPMKKASIPLLAVFFLLLSGCSDHTAVKKTVEATSTVTALTVKKLTPEEKFSELQKEAGAGDAEAQIQIGIMYAEGNGIPKDATKAIEWLQKAAMQGHARGQYDLGLAYSRGEGVPENVIKAAELEQKAADQGFAPAQGLLGWMYANGEGVPKDLDKAVAWYQKAANQRDAIAQFNLGGMYARGEGVLKNKVKAVELYQKSATQGNADAQNEIGLAYLRGDGVPRDDTKSFEWTQKAAVQGLAEAQFMLGTIYYGNGTGVSRNLVLAYTWLNLSSAQGNQGYKYFRDLIEAQLTSPQRAEGQHLASNWKKGDILQTSYDSESNPTKPNSKPTKYSTGTAFTVSSSHALTNHHVIADCTEVKIAGHEGVAKVIVSDGINDIALLQLPNKTNDIATIHADPGKLRQGEEIIVFGYPLDSILSAGGNLTPGIISALSGLDNNTNQIQITAPIQGGSSGSPVMDKKGNVVGVVSAKLDMKALRATGGIPQNVNFAVNGQTVKAFLDANKVPYKTGGGFFSREKSNADIAEEARKSTMLVECWK